MKEDDTGREEPARLPTMHVREGSIGARNALLFLTSHGTHAKYACTSRIVKSFVSL